jgi:hypothetical protein
MHEYKLQACQHDQQPLHMAQALRIQLPVAKHIANTMLQYCIQRYGYIDTFVYIV